MAARYSDRVDGPEAVPAAANEDSICLYAGQKRLKLLSLEA